MVKLLVILFAWGVMLVGLDGVAQAAQQIQVKAHFADVPADADIPSAAEKASALKGATLLSSPQVVVAENVEGNIEVVQPASVPGGRQVELGVTLAVKASVTEKGNIWFSGKLTDRSRGGGQKTERLETAGFAVREWFFSGWTPNGGTVLVRTTPVSSRTVREGKTVTNSRELVVYLTFKKVTPPKKAATSTKTTSKKSGLRTTTRRKR